MLLDLRSLFEEGTVTANAALTEADEALSSAVAVLVQGASSFTEADDAVSASAVALIGATAGITEADDSLAADGAVLVQAAGALADDAEVLAAAAAVLVQSSAALSEADDAIAASGTVTNTQPIIADAALAEDDDAMAAFGIAAWPFDPLSMASFPLAIATRGRRNRPRPPLGADADLVEEADGLKATASLSGRGRRVQNEEWLLRRAA